MLRVVAIVFISFALSACRTNNDESDTTPTSTQSTASTYSQKNIPGSPATKLPTTTDNTPTNTDSSQQLNQLTSTTNAVYTAQPVSPPESANEVTYEDVSVTLEWSIPLQRENGVLLSASDLTGYIIEYSSQSGPLTQERVQGGQSSSNTLNLPPGAYQFRVIAVDSNDVRSKPSDWINADLA
jgi:nitrous oxide reductase accessory protein NosL